MAIVDNHCLKKLSFAPDLGMVNKILTILNNKNFFLKANLQEFLKITQNPSKVALYQIDKHTIRIAIVGNTSIFGREPAC